MLLPLEQCWKLHNQVLHATHSHPPVAWDSACAVVRHCYTCDKVSFACCWKLERFKVLSVLSCLYFLAIWSNICNILLSSDLVWSMLSCLPTWQVDLFSVKIICLEPEIAHSRQQFSTSHVDQPWTTISNSFKAVTYQVCPSQSCLSKIWYNIFP